MPTFNQRARFNIEQIEATADGLVNDVVDRFWLVIKSRYRRHDNGAVLGRCHHTSQVTEMQRCFAHDQHEAPPLFQYDIRRAAYQTSSGSVSDVRKGADGARDDDHPSRLERAARNRRSHIAIQIADLGHFTKITDAQTGFLFQSQSSCLRDDQVCGNAILTQHPQHSDAVERPRGTADTDDEGQGPTHSGRFR